jgi:hypothetical protein
LDSKTQTSGSHGSLNGTTPSYPGFFFAPILIFGANEKTHDFNQISMLFEFWGSTRLKKYTDTISLNTQDTTGTHGE